MGHSAVIVEPNSVSRNDKNVAAVAAKTLKNCYPPAPHFFSKRIDSNTVDGLGWCLCLITKKEGREFESRVPTVPPLF
jgi:hypothetical protein